MKLAIEIARENKVYAGLMILLLFFTGTAFENALLGAGSWKEFFWMSLLCGFFGLVPLKAREVRFELWSWLVRTFFRQQLPRS